VAEDVAEWANNARRANKIGAKIKKLVTSWIDLRGWRWRVVVLSEHPADRRYYSRMGKEPDGTAGKRPPAPSVTQRPMTLILRKTCVQAGIEGLRKDIWGEDDYAVVDGETRSGACTANPSTANGDDCGSSRPNRRRRPIRAWPARWRKPWQNSNGRPRQ
jgi:hypothetical protein